MRKSVMRIAVLCLAAVVGAGLMGVRSDAATKDTAAPAQAAPRCGGERPTAPDGGSYTCTFTDDFNGSSVDSDSWMTQDSSYSGMTTANKDCYVDSPQTVSQSGGAVHISAVRTAPFTCHSPYGDFTTSTKVGTIATRSHFAQTYGRFEFRARFPRETGAGVHSALWLYPAANTYGAWPNSGEIDVAEWFSNYPTYVLPSAHYAGEVTGLSSGLTCRTATPQSYHTYAVDWTPDGILRFSLDGRVCWQHNWTVWSKLSGLAPFDQPFYIVLSQAFGAADNAPTAATPTVNTMDVDWVRAFGWSAGRAATSSSGTSSSKQTVRGIGQPLHFVHR